MDKVIKVAMLTGYHPYEVTGFQDMLSSLTELKIYPQNIEEFIFSHGGTAGKCSGLSTEN